MLWAQNMGSNSSLTTHSAYPAAAAKWLQSCPTLCDPVDCSPPGSSVHGIFQARVLEWVAIAFAAAYPSDDLIFCSSIFPSVQFSSVSQSCPTLCDPMNCSMPGLPVHHQLPESTQTHVHRGSDAIQPSHPLLSPSPPALNLSQHGVTLEHISGSCQGISWLNIFLISL